MNPLEELKAQSNLAELQFLRSSDLRREIEKEYQLARDVFSEARQAYLVAATGVAL